MNKASLFPAAWLACGLAMLAATPASAQNAAAMTAPASATVAAPPGAATSAVAALTAGAPASVTIGAPTTTRVAAPTPAVGHAPGAEAAAPTAAPAATATPVPNKGDTAWMLIAAALVGLMTLPGLALFYGGMVRSKNMLSIIMQCLSIFSVVGILWVVYGYSLAFTAGNPFIGGLDKIMLRGITPASVASTFSKDVYIPELAFVVFQFTFAAITCALVVGGFAERVKFKAVMVFTVIWFTISYLPMAHMVWLWDGPDAYSAAGAITDTANHHAGFLWQMGALDFAGGTVVHVNAGVAGLVGALMAGKRVGFGRVAMPPHSLTMTSIGASLLWFGWFGFNAGSNLEANGYAALAFVNTMFATCAATVAWGIAEWVHKGRPSVLGAISGAIAGLVGITPACGYVGVGGALVVGLVTSLICFFAVTWLKNKLGYDDTLDTFGVHGVGGFTGALLTGVLVNPVLGGQGFVSDWVTAVPGYDYGQIFIQLKAASFAVLWSGVMSAIAFTITRFVCGGLRVTEDQEREGLDIVDHGEQAYNH